jgi:hypothetical protein
VLTSPPQDSGGKPGPLQSARAGDDLRAPPRPPVCLHESGLLGARCGVGRTALRFDPTTRLPILRPPAPPHFKHATQAPSPPPPPPPNSPPAGMLCAPHPQLAPRGDTSSTATSPYTRCTPCNPRGGREWPWRAFVLRAAPPRAAPPLGGAPALSAGGSGRGRGGAGRAGVAAAAVDRAFERCYRDTAPFDRVP